MADASFVQDRFTGGEWSPFAQGRITDPKYRSAMNVCLNGMPVEEGAWVRRPGTAFMQTTRSGVFGRVLPFDFNDTMPFSIEVTADHLRLFAGRGLVFDSVAGVVNISNQNPAIVSTTGQNWVTGDQVQFLFSSGGGQASGAILRNRVLAITRINANQFTMTDPVTGAVVNGSDVNWLPAQVTAQVARVLDFSTAYSNADLPLLRRVQASGVGVNNADIAILLSGAHSPQQLIASLDANSPDFSTFQFKALNLQDGPYMDIPDGATLQISGATNPFTATITYQTWSSTTLYRQGAFVTFSGLVYQSQHENNIGLQPDTHPNDWDQVNLGAAVGINGVQAGDVGRAIRMLSEPSAWSTGSSYSPGDAVAWAGVYYTNQQATSPPGLPPDLALDSWTPTTSIAVAAWVAGVISAVHSSNSFDVTWYSSPGILYNLPIQQFRVGVFADSVGWPSCGAYYGGRLWLGGVVPNRFDASVANDPFNFAPTAPDGAVGDANAISEQFNSDDKNTLYWMEPTASGLLCGTKKGEWLISASNLKDPITPTSIQADRVTKVGCANILPTHTPLSMVVVQRFQRLLFEIFPDLFSGKLTAPNLNKDSKHLTTPGVAEVAYQSELAPIVWGRNNDGSLVGWTYRRKTAQSAAEPDMVGGFRVELGSDREVTSLCVNATPAQTSDAALMVTKDDDGVYHVEQMTRVLDPQDAFTSAWFVDDAVTPSGMITDATGVTFVGLWHLNGHTISVVCGGLDLGDYQVTNGQVHVNYMADAGKFFTLAYLQSLDGGTYGDLAATVNTSVTTARGSVVNPMTIRKFADPSHSDVLTTTIAKPNHVDFSAWFQGGSGLHKLQLQNFTDVQYVNYATVAASGGGAGMDIGTWDWTVGLDGFIYCAQVGANQSPWIKIDPATSTIVGTFGVNSTFWSGGPTGMGRPRSCTALTVNAKNYVIGVNMVSAFTNTINWLRGDNMTYVTNGGRFDIESGFSGSILRGPVNANGGTVYVISAPQTLNPSPDHFTLYQSSIDLDEQVTGSVIGTILPAQIDPQWTFFNGVSMGYDQLDGNLLMSFSSGVFPATTLTNPNYICKMRVSDLSIIWKVAIPGGVTDGFNGSRVEHGVLSWIGDTSSPGNRYVYSMNTVDGSYTRFIVNNSIPAGLAFSDDTTGILYSFINYAHTVDPNSPLPGLNTPEAFVGFSAFTPGDIFRGSTTSTTSLTIPAVLGFTYTSQGQIVRPALPAEAGSANGPAQGKTRRSHMYSLLVAAAIYGTIACGTVFGKLRPVNFKQPNERPYDTKTLFSGVHWDTLEDNYSFEGGLAWEITRPLPASLSSVGGFINTQDR